MPLEGNLKIEICHGNLKLKQFKIFIFEIWNENTCLKFEKQIDHTTRGK
jgi:hypothetical protein